MCAGQDTSEEFEEIGHSESARHQAVPYEIGVLEGHEETATGCVVPKDDKAKKVRQTESRAVRQTQHTDGTHLCVASHLNVVYMCRQPRPAVAG